MLKWNSEKEKKQAKEAFEKWNGFHEDALDSEGLKPREHVSHISLRSSENTVANSLMQSA